MTAASILPRRVALVGYATSTLLAFPHELPGVGAVDLGLLFAWLIPAFLVVGIQGRSARDAARSAFLASLVGHVVLFHWFFVVTVSYGGMSSWLGLLSPLVPSIYVSIFSALFAAGWVSLRTRGIGAVLLGAALWVTVDWCRAHFLGGFPWATLGYALHLDLPMLALTRLAGVYGLSFVAAAMGITLAQAFLDWNAGSRRLLVQVLVGLGAIHLMGTFSDSPSERLKHAADTQAESASHRSVRIAAIQGNVDQGLKWNEDRRSQILEKYLGLSGAAVEQGAEWIVWPETAVPGFVELDPELSERLARFARRHGVALVVGGMGIAPDATGTRVGAFFDSAFVFDRLGLRVDRYDKSQLVPFGEFVPLRALLGRFFKALATGLSATDVTPGSAPRLVRWENLRGGARDSIGGTSDGQSDGTAVRSGALPDAAIHDSSEEGGRSDAYRVAVPICYELLFPHVVSGFGAAGADVILAITNDAWYGRTGAPHQFLAMTAMRAAENGRWIVRAANTGISAIIDDRGRVREGTALFEDSLIVADVPVGRYPQPTFYARFGDVFAVLCGLGVVSRWVWIGTRARATSGDA